MRALVAGGAGFLGAHLCDRLLQKGYHVTAVDNLSTGFLENIASLENHNNFQFIRHDICSSLHLEVDEIYNLACPASPVHYQSDPLQTLRTNIMGSMNLLELAKENGAKIMQASTSEVYGDPLVHPQKELYWGNVNPMGQRSCYDEGKRCAETFFYEYHKQKNVDIRVVRVFNTYGPKMHPNDGRVISNFIIQALRNAPLTVYGKGLQTRSFCYVDDLIRGIMAFNDLQETCDFPVNLGNPEEFTVLELAQFIIELTNSRSKIVFCPLPQDDPQKRRPDISLAKKILGWQPIVPLKEGLLRTISYFDTELSYAQPNVVV
ncbi:MAG: SDR family oxidoreductase [Parachlamydiales bacterium]|nr:SDR family oxidoreductase [Parachlamydiales bacterium]